MPLQYVSDNTGSTIAVQIPIDDWNILKERYEQQQEIPQWHKNILDERMKNYSLHQNQVTSLQDFIIEMNKDQNEEV